MNSMREWWQSFPLSFDPVALSIGFFDIRWYGICFVLGGALVYFLARLKFSSGEEKEFESHWDDIFLFACIGGLIGARLFFVLFYGSEYFLMHPLEIFFPTNGEGQFSGYRGMSFHGGVIGAVFGIWIRVRAFGKEYFLRILDFSVLLFPIWIFFGRLGNFLNLELPGRETSVAWGVRFAEGGYLHHPSTLYAAFAEGILLFLVLAFFRRHIQKAGLLSVFFVFWYGAFRFVDEFFRVPDREIGFLYGLTLGQWLSLGMVGIAVGFLWWQKRPKNAIL